MVKGPFQQRDPSPFLALKSLQFYDLVIDIKHLVMHFLNRTFYNINTYVNTLLRTKSPSPSPSHVLVLLCSIGKLSER